MRISLTKIVIVRVIVFSFIVIIFVISIVVVNVFVIIFRRFLTIFINKKLFFNIKKYIS